MWTTINIFLKAVDDFVWGVPLMVLIMAGGIMLTVRLGLLQMRKLPLALKWDIHLPLQSVLLIPICSSMSQNIKHN